MYDSTNEKNDIVNLSVFLSKHNINTLRKGKKETLKEEEGLLDQRVNPNSLGIPNGDLLRTMEKVKVLKIFKNFAFKMERKCTEQKRLENEDLKHASWAESLGDAQNTLGI